MTYSEMLTGLWRIIDDTAKYREARILIDAWVEFEMQLVAEEIERLRSVISQMEDS